MIRSFRHKGLAGLFLDNDPRKVRHDLIGRCRIRLRALHGARALRDLSVPGFDFHGLQGKPKRYSIRVNGPWRITFEWIDRDAWRVDLEQYH